MQNRESALVLVCVDFLQLETQLLKLCVGHEEIKVQLLEELQF